MPKLSGLLALLRSKWNPPAVPTSSFKGKTVLITGSNTGLGFHAAQHFVRLKASNIILGVRNISKGEAARTELKTSGEASKIDVLQLNMDSLASVKSFADQLNQDYKRIDIAVLNAGLYNMAYKTSPEEWEETLQVNALSTALLSLLLLPILRGSKQADPSSTPHLILVSSGRHATVSPSFFPSPPQPTLPSFKAPPTPTSSFNGSRQYAISKLLLMYTLKPLAVLATSPGGVPQLIITSCCPGFCVSSPGQGVKSWYLKWARWAFYKVFARSTEEGSRTLVSACSLGEEAQGGYWKNDKLIRPGEMVTSADRNLVGEQVWRETVDVLKGKVPEVEGIAREPT